MFFKDQVWDRCRETHPGSDSMKNEFMEMMAAGGDAVGFDKVIRGTASTGLAECRRTRVLAVIGPGSGGESRKGGFYVTLRFLVVFFSGVFRFSLSKSIVLIPCLRTGRSALIVSNTAS